MSEKHTAGMDATAIFDILAHPHRRHLLRCLSRYDEPLALADLAEGTAERVLDTPLQDISAETIKRIYMSLYHRDIPKLADVGVVEYDQEQDIVVPNPIVDELAAILDDLTSVQSRL